MPSKPALEVCWGRQGGWSPQLGPQDTQPHHLLHAMPPWKAPFRGQAHTAGPSLQTRPRLGGAPAIFSPKTGAHLESPPTENTAPQLGVPAALSPGGQHWEDGVTAAATGVRGRSPWAERGVLTGSTRTGGAATQLSPQKGPTAPALRLPGQGPRHPAVSCSVS